MADVMDQALHPFERVREGMEVYGCQGQKIGSVGDVHVGSDFAGAVGVADAQERSYFEARSGPLGLGKHLWFEARDVQDVGKKRVTLKYSKEEATERGQAGPPGA